MWELLSIMDLHVPFFPQVWEVVGHYYFTSIMYIHFSFWLCPRSFIGFLHFFILFFFFWLFLLDYFIYPVFLVTDSFAHFSLLLKLLHSSVQCILYLYCFPNFIKLSVFFDNSLKFKRIILNYLTPHISSLL